jgi:hypothetical protein
MADATIPGFHKRVARGEIFFNNMSRSQRDYSVSGSGYYIRDHKNVICGSNPSKRAEWMTDGTPMVDICPVEVIDGSNAPIIYGVLDPADLRRAEIEASTGLLNKRGRGDSNLYETLAEAEKTIGMFRSPLGRLTGWLNHVSSLSQKGQGSRAVVKTAADLWLTYRFGIRPIVGDINNIMSALRKTVRSERKTSREKLRLYGENSQSFVTSYGATNLSWTRRSTEEVIIRAMSLDEIDSTFWDDFGLSPKGLMTLPWELVSCSWVYDYFLNIGDYLGALAPAVGWKQLGSCLTAKRTLQNINSMSSFVLKDPTTYTILGMPSGTVSVTEVTKKRRPLDTPQVVVRSDFRFDSATRMANLFALAAQRFGKVLGVTGAMSAPRRH